MALCAGAAEVACQLAIDVGVRSDTVAMNVQLLVVHQATLLAEYDRLDVGKIRQRVNQFQLCNLPHIGIYLSVITLRWLFLPPTT